MNKSKSQLSPWNWITIYCKHELLELNWWSSRIIPKNNYPKFQSSHMLWAELASSEFYPDGSLIEKSLKVTQPNVTHFFSWVTGYYFYVILIPGIIQIKWMIHLIVTCVPRASPTSSTIHFHVMYPLYTSFFHQPLYISKPVLRNS